MKKNKGKIVVIILLILAIIAGGTYLWNENRNKGETPKDDPEVIVVDEDKYDLEALRKIWEANKKKNEDYVGQITFASGLVDLPFVQGATNDTYLRRDWETNDYDEEGSIFLDSQNKLTDQNLVIYGHFVYKQYDPERTHKFTPLEKLLSPDNYEDNKELILVLEDGVREYEVVQVFYCDLEADESGNYVYAREDLQYYWLNKGDSYFDYDDRSINEEYFDNYVKVARSRAAYDIDAEYTLDDNFLTLQTCVENHGELREIVLCKEVARYPYK